MFCKDWQPPFAAYTWLGVICIIAQVVILPESPKWLLLKGRKDDAVAALN